MNGLFSSKAQKMWVFCDLGTGWLLDIINSICRNIMRINYYYLPKICSTQRCKLKLTFFKHIYQKGRRDGKDNSIWYFTSLFQPCSCPVECTRLTFWLNVTVSHHLEHFCMNRGIKGMNERDLREEREHGKLNVTNFVLLKATSLFE